MAGIVYEPPASPAAQPIPSIGQGAGFSPQSFRDKKEQYDDLMNAVLSQRTSGWLDGLAKVATAGVLGYQKTKNQDRADSERAKAGEGLSKLIDALSGRGRSGGATSTAPKLVDAIATARGAPPVGQVGSKPLPPIGAAPPVGGGMQPPAEGGQPMNYGPGSSAMPAPPMAGITPTPTDYTVGQATGNLMAGIGQDQVPGGAGADMTYGKLPPDMIRMESGGQQFDRNGQPLTSPAGAIGIAQVMPATGPEAAQLAGLPWDEQRYRNDAQYNEALGAAYYQAQLAKFGDPELARAAYNAGPGRTSQYVNGGRPLPAETMKYADMNGDGRVGGGAPMPPPVAGGSSQDTMTGGAGPDTMQQGQQFGPEVLQAALSILSNQWADDGQKQVAGMILTQALKSQAPVQWEKLNDTTLYNPMTQETKQVGGAANGLAPGNFDDQAKLRGEYLKQSGDFVSVRDAFGRLQAAAQDTTGASDVAMVYAFMKMLDPGSVVREGEFATAENTAGIPDQIRQLYNRALTGERLPPQVRADFLQQGGRQFVGAKSRQDAVVKQYGTLAQRYGFDPSVIGIDLSAGVGMPEGPATGSGGGNQQAAPRAVNPQTGQAVIWNGTAWVPEGAQ